MKHQPTDSVNLARLLFGMVQDGQEPLLGYDTAGALIGRDKGGASRHMGQVTSRIDAACFESGLPMLATHMVRMPNGAFNPNMFRDEWTEFREEIQDVAANHTWTGDERDKVMRALGSLPENSARTIWQHYAERGREFIRCNLHRNVADLKYLRLPMPSDPPGSIGKPLPARRREVGDVPHVPTELDELLKE